MKSYIIRNAAGNTKVCLDHATAEKLNSIAPKGCPFEDYTFLDLLKDYVYQYDWCVLGKMGLIEFINLISNKSFNAYMYEKTIINICEQEV